MQDNSFDLSYTFNDKLRDIPNNYSEFVRYTEFLRSEISEEPDLLSKAKLLSKLGGYQRIIGKLKESEENLKLAIKIFETFGNLKNIFVAKIRLAHTYQFQKNFDISNKMFDGLIHEAESNPDLIDYQDFAYQHSGKNQFDQSNYNKALELFNKALDIRILKQNDELIKSTKYAIEVTQVKSS
jgi:tetratricopeptide (TPR) repeat protein